MRVERPIYGGTWTTEGGGALPFVITGEEIRAGGEVEPSANRREPGCVHFTACGGCQYQHGVYPAQVEWKREILGGLMDAAGLMDLPGIVVESGPEWGYRNRIRLRVRQTADGTCFGYSLRGSHEFLRVRMCPIAAPVLWRAAETMAFHAATDARIRAWLGATTEVELFCTGDESRMQAVFYVQDVKAAKRLALSFAAMCHRLRELVGELVGAAAQVDPGASRNVRRRWDGVAWGVAGLGYEAAGRAYWLPRESFFQVNRFLVDRLVEIVTEDKAGDLVWDLYAGVGLFSRALADRFGHVVAVEGAETAFHSLRAAAKAKGNIEPVQAATVDFLKARELQRQRPSLVILDPPRVGLGVEGANVLTRLGAANVVYVSCDPTSLVRDLQVLCRTYKVDRVTLIDLFPQTFHIETVVHLSR